MNYTLIEAAQVQPVNFIQIQDHLILDFDMDENVMQELIEMYTKRFEEHTHRCLINQIWELTTDCFERKIELRKGNVNAIVSVTYTDADEVEHTIDPSNYRMIGSTTAKSIVFKKDFVLPTNLDEYEAVKIQVICGYGEDPESVPADIRGALALAIANAFENRGEDASVEIPEIAMMIFNAYKIINL